MPAVTGRVQPADPVVAGDARPPSLSARVRSALLWTGGTRVVSQALTWVITLVVIRLLSPADYGLLAMAGISVNFLVLLAEAGLGTAVIQSSKLDANDLPRIFGAVIVIDLALFVLLVGCAPVIATLFNEPRLTPIIRALALQLPLMMFAVMPHALLAKALEFKQQSLVEMISALGGSVLVLVLALAGHGVWALVAGSLAAQLIRTIGINLVAPYFHRPRFSLGGIRGALGFGAQVSAARVLWFVYSQFDLMIAGRMLGKDLLGAYAVAMHLASLPVQKLSSIMNQVTLPAFAQLQHQPQDLARHLLSMVGLLSLVSFPVLWGMASVAPEIGEVILGEQWHATIAPLQLLPLVMPLTMLSPFFNAAFQGIGHAGIVLRNVATMSVVMVIALLVGVHWELAGLAWAWVIGFPIAFGLSLRRMLPLVGLSIFAVVRAIGPAALSAAAMVGAVTLARWWFQASINGPLRLVALVCLGAAVYAAITTLINRRAIALLRQFVTQRAAGTAAKAAPLQA